MMRVRPYFLSYKSIKLVDRTNINSEKSIKILFLVVMSLIWIRRLFVEDLGPFGLPLPLL